MQRLWRCKPSKELIEIMELSVDLRLYLIQEKGPLSFLFQDEHRKKFSITIGEEIFCSCGGGKKEHCIHTMYVLNRIFKIDFTDVLILQLNYTDAEISKMLINRNSHNKTSSITKNKKKNSEIHIESTTPGHKMSLHDDTSCSICQEDMYTIEGLFFCAQSCGHHFHISCLKIWADHKTSSSDIISCPMCRAEWDEDDLRKSILKNYSQKIILKPHKGIDCMVCERKNIKGERFHCLTCDDTNICVECFNLRKHGEEHYFLIKKLSSDKWLGVEYSNNVSDANKYLVKNIKLSQFLVSLLKDYNKKSEESYEKIRESQTDTPVDHSDCNKCIVCKSDRVSSLALLKFKSLLRCKHLVHFKCAESLFKIMLCKNNEYCADNNFNKCLFDDLEIFPGLKSLAFEMKGEDDQKESKLEMLNKINSKKVLINKIGNIYTTNLQFKQNNNNNLNNKSSKNSQMKLRTASHSNRNNLKNIQMNCENNFNFALDIQKVDFNFDNNIHKYEKSENAEIKKKRVDIMRKNYSSKPKIKKIIIPEIQGTIATNIDTESKIVIKNFVKGVKSVNMKNIQFKVYIYIYLLSYLQYFLKLIYDSLGITEIILLRKFIKSLVLNFIEKNIYRRITHIIINLRISVI